MSVAILRLIGGEGFPPVGTLMFTAIWGRDRAKVGPLSSTEKLIVGQEIAFKIKRSLDERLLESEPRLYLKCSYKSPSDEHHDFGSISVPLHPAESGSVEKRFTFEEAPVFDEAGCPTWSLDEPVRPTLRVSTFFEVDGDESSPNSILDNEETRIDRFTRLDDAMQPVLINDEYFLIGRTAEAEEQQFYNISVAVSFAENLHHLLPWESDWPLQGLVCQFRFNLLGNTIKLRSFSDMKDSVKIAERATATIRCTPKCLLRFLKQSMPSLKVCLFCEDIAVGEATIPIREQLEVNRREDSILDGMIRLEPVNISGIYHITPLRVSEIGGNGCTSMKPRVGVVVMISQAIPELNTSDPSIQLSTRKGFKHLSSAAPSLPSSKGILDGGLRPSAAQQPDLQQLLYNAAFELELWKEEQKLLEGDRQERSKAEYMGLLNSEYRRQVSLKELAFDRRVRRIVDLERQLEDALQVVRQREQELQEEKKKLNRQRGQMARDKCQIDTQVERATQNLQKKHNFALEAERRRHKEIVNEIRRMHKLQLEESNRRIAELQKELDNLKMSGEVSRV